MPKVLANEITPDSLKAVVPGFVGTQLTDGRRLYVKLFWERHAHQWRFDFKSPVGGKRKTLILGDAITQGSKKQLEAHLDDMRARAAKLRVMIANGICPSQARDESQKAKEVAAIHEERKAKGLPALGTFEAVARELLAIKYTEGRKSNSVGKLFADRWIKNLERHVFPKIGGKHVKNIEPVQVLECIQVLENDAKMETARMVRRYCSEVFERAMVLRLREWNPVAAIKGSVRKKKKALTKNFAAVLEPERIGELMAAIHGYQGNSAIRECLLACAYTFQRPGSVRHMEWRQLDLEKAEWVIPATFLKQPEELKRDERFFHIVPLSRQMVGMLQAMRLDARPDARFVFENQTVEVRHLRPLGANTPSDALAKLDFKSVMTAHGFRAMARTVGKRHCKIDPDVIEAQLAHSNGDPNGNAYDREQHLPERKAAMQVWADYLDQLRDGAKAQSEAKSKARQQVAA